MGRRQAARRSRAAVTTSNRLYEQPIVEIVGGDHDPPHTYMVVAGHGFLIDLSRIAGELWD
jgi:hypothetical protein